MQPWQRDLLVARVISGSVRCCVKDHQDRATTILLKRPSRDDNYIACEIFKDSFEKAQEMGLLEDDELFTHLVKNRLWDEKRQKLLDCLPKEIENFKLELFRSNFKKRQREVIRQALNKAKHSLAEATTQRHAYDHLSCSGTASIVKSRFLIGKSLFKESGRPIFGDDDFWDRPSILLDNVMVWITGNRLNDADFRELARTEPWRSVWMARKIEGGLFGIAPADYTDEQKVLATWSTIYDNAYQHPECPDDEVIDDDDVFDGWMIEQRNKRDVDMKKSKVNDAVSDKIRNSQEIFLMADNPEDARKIMDQNDPQAQAMQKRRFDLIKEKGTVSEMEMPDTRQRFRKELNQRFSQLMRQGK